VEKNVLVPEEDGSEELETLAIVEVLCRAGNRRYPGNYSSVATRPTTYAKEGPFTSEKAMRRQEKGGATGLLVAPWT